MDPAFHEARQRFTKKKPVPSQTPYKKTKFQRQILRNPYAQALATPIRRCTVSVTTAPNFFLQKFSLIRHPENDETWYVPQGLGKKTPKEISEESDASLKALEQEEADAQDEVEAEVKAEEVDEASTEDSTTAGPSAYVLTRRYLFQQLVKSGSPYHRGQTKLLRMNDSGSGRLTHLLNSVRWRTDMDSYLLDLMRRRIVESLVHFALMVEKNDRKYITKCESWDEVHELKHRGCLLFLDPSEGVSENSETIFPPLLSTMATNNSKYGERLPVHNLSLLLGEEHISRLREETELFRDGSLYMLGRQATVKLQMLLWKLQGYVSLEQAPERSAEK
ncbi:hypothetical protein QBC35DRAFT_514263 [Podospora australis]|uniref:Uncharacterized protein n=1 Tax=Podospora australis TaxID=1536484 RepID=A0AAN7AJM7_9PEZI|nr:hypothetical protein QBC35DRAFT_514263 [Podospora australis]